MTITIYYIKDQDVHLTRITCNEHLHKTLDGIYEYFMVHFRVSVKVTTVLHNSLRWNICKWIENEITWSINTCNKHLWVCQYWPQLQTQSNTKKDQILQQITCAYRKYLCGTYDKIDDFERSQGFITKLKPWPHAREIRPTMYATSKLSNDSWKFAKPLDE